MQYFYFKVFKQIKWPIPLPPTHCNKNVSATNPIIFLSHACPKTLRWKKILIFITCKNQLPKDSVSMWICHVHKNKIREKILIERWEAFQFQLWILVWVLFGSSLVWVWSYHHWYYLVVCLRNKEWYWYSLWLWLSSNTSRPTKSYVQSLQNKQVNLRDSKRSIILLSRPTLWLCLAMESNENY